MVFNKKLIRPSTGETGDIPCQIADNINGQRVCCNALMAATNVHTPGKIVFPLRRAADDSMDVSATRTGLHSIPQLSLQSPFFVTDAV